MKILHTVESYLPARHGMSEVVRQISERLVKRGHHVTVATSRDSRRESEQIEGVEVRSFDVYGKTAIGVWGDVYGYQKFLLDFNPDVIVNFAAQQWATDLTLPILSRLKARKVFVPTGFSALSDPLFRNYFLSMRDWLRGYDACVFLSDSYRDIDFARNSGIERIAIIPNGAASEEFDRNKDYGFRKRIGIPADHQLILHVAGYLSVSKGQLEAVKIFSRSSLRSATLLLVCPAFTEKIINPFTPRQFLKTLYHFARGNGFRGIAFPAQLQLLRRLTQQRNKSFGRQTLGLSLSREDTISAFLEADLLLFPSWIECSPLVLFEAAASRTPFLVTDVGNASEIIGWTAGGRLLPGVPNNDKEGSLRPDVQASVSILEALMADLDTRQQMATSAHRAWLRHFTWSKIADQYEQLYRKLIAGESIKDLFPPPPSV